MASLFKDTDFALIDDTVDEVSLARKGLLDVEDLVDPNQFAESISQTQSFFRLIEQSKSMGTGIAPPPTSFTEGFKSGLTGGLLGEEPDEFFSRAQLGELTGDLILFGLLFSVIGAGLGGAGLGAKLAVKGGRTLLLNEARGAGLKGLSELTIAEAQLFERTVFGGTRGLLTGASFASITEAEDNWLIPVMMGFGVVETIVPGIRAARRLRKAAKVRVTKAGQSSGDLAEELIVSPESIVTPEFIEREIINVPKLPESKVKTSIEGLIKVSDDLDALDTSVFTKSQLRLDEFQFGKDNMKFHTALSEARQIAREEFDNILRKDFKGTLTQLEYDLMVESLPDTGLMGRSQAMNILSARIRTGQLVINDNPFKSIISLTNRMQEFKLKLDKMEQAVVFGLNPNATLDNIIKAADDFVIAAEKEGFKIVNNKTRKALLAKGIKSIDDFIEAVKKEGVAPELALTKDFIEFAQKIGKFVNPEDMTLRSQKLQESLKDLVKNNKKFIKSMSDDIRKAFNENTQAKEAILDFEEKILHTRISSGDVVDVPRGDLVDYISGELGVLSLIDAAPEIAARRKDIIRKILESVKPARRTAMLEQLKTLESQVVERFFTDEAFAKVVIESSNNTLLRKANLLYRASLGDTRAITELRGMSEASLSTLSRDTITTQLIINNVDSFKAPGQKFVPKVVGKKGGEKPPPDVPTSTSDDASKLDTAESIVAEVFESKRPQAFLERHLRPLSVIFSNRGIKTKSPVMRLLYQKGEKLIRDTFLAENKILKDRETIYKPLLLELDNSINAIKNPELKEASIKFIDDVSVKINGFIDSKMATTQINREIAQMVSSQPESVQKVYNSFRKVTDKLHEETNKAINIINDMIEAGTVPGAKLTPLEYRPGYVPYLYDGAFNIEVLEETISAAGKISTRSVWHDFVHSSDEAIKSLNRYFAGTTSTTGKIVIKPRYITSEEQSFILGSTLDDINKVYGRPAVEVKDLLKNKTLTSSSLNDVFFGHKLKRTLNLEEKRIDTLTSLNLLIHANQRFQNYTPLFRRMQTVKAGFAERGFNMEADSLQIYYEDLIGRSRAFEQQVDNMINGAMNKLWEFPPAASAMNAIGLQRNSRVVRKVASTLNLFGRLAVLGFNPGSAIINTFILPTNVAGSIGIRNLMFGLGNIRSALNTSSTTNKFRELFSHLGLDIRPTSFGFKDTINSAVLQKGSSKYLEKLDNWGMWLFNTSENMARGVTAIGSVNQAKQMAKRLIAGKTPKTWQEKRLVRISEELGRSLDDKITQFEYARFMVDKTNFRFTLADTPELLRNPVLRPMLQFKSFFLKEMDLFIFDAEWGARERFIAFGMLGALGGAMAMPFVDDLDRVGIAMFGISPKLWFEQNLPEVMAIGIPSLLGLDFSGRANFGEVASFTKNPVGLALPRIWDGIAALAKGDTELAANRLAPVSVTNFMNAIEFLNTGVSRSAFTGSTLSTSADRTGLLTTLGSFVGFKSPAQLSASRKLEVGRAISRNAKELRRTALKLYLNALSDGNPRKADKIARDNGLTSQMITAAMRLRGRTRMEQMQETLGKDLSEEHKELFEGLR